MPSSTYLRLHSSPPGCRYGRVHGDLAVTSDVSDRLVRLPLWIGLEEHMQNVLAVASTALGA